jgi:hypothetical protein
MREAAARLQSEVADVQMPGLDNAAQRLLFLICTVATGMQ